MIKMKNIKNIGGLVLLTFVLLSLGSCEKYLEQAPDMRTELNNIDKIKSLLGTAYPIGNYATMLESASDNVADKGPNTAGVQHYEINRGPFMFEDVGSELNQDSPTYYWNNAWRAIAAANHALHAIELGDFGPEVLPYKGEALLARAYAHFMLVTIFARAYDPVDAAQYPGVPYVTEPGTEVQAQYDRGTVASVYEQIEKDLLEGLALISDDAYTVPKFHFNRQAANAFASRFFLFKRDWDKVVQYSNEVFPEGRYSAALRPWITMYNSWTTEMQRVNYTRSNDPANLMLGQTTSWWGRRYYLYRFGITAALNNQLMRTPTVTGAPWGQTISSYSSGTNFRHNKFVEHFVYTTATTGSGRIMMPLFTAEEALFNRAEAYANLGQMDLALADLNLYASKRISGYNQNNHQVTLDKIADFYETTDPRDGVIQTVLDFRRAEFVQEGLRWFDILRHQLPVTHHVLAADGSIERTIVVEHGDPRRMFQLPEEVQLAGIELNPR